jgi:mannose-6-phosphate isomerase
MPPLYPLTFRPIYRSYLWGGRRLESLLGKSLGPEAKYAESWEIVDHGDDQSVVAEGLLAGITLGELVQERGEELLGPGRRHDAFPLLFKFLDAHKVLSVQVHPDDAYAAKLNPPDLGKTEAWVVLHADPGSKIYAGLKPGIDRETLRAEIEAGRTAETLHVFEPKAGDCVFIPAGTIHALGAGLVVAEIQQSSDTTYRLYDWDRVDDAGNRRPLHIEEALETTDFRRGPVDQVEPQPTDDGLGERLVDCDKFTLDRYRATEAVPLNASRSCRLIAVLEGTCDIVPDSDGKALSLAKGSTCLVPASVGRFELRPQNATTALVISLP